MPAISRGFHGRRHDDVEAARLAPGQYLTQDFPVLSAGPTPHQPLDAWTFEIRGKVDEPRSWTWQQFKALPRERITVDIHCVTKWSKFDTTWTGVSIDTLLEGVETSVDEDRPARRRAQAARPRRRLLRLGGVARWTAPPRRRWLGRGPAAGDAPLPTRSSRS